MAEPGETTTVKAPTRFSSGLSGFSSFAQQKTGQTLAPDIFAWLHRPFDCFSSLAPPPETTAGPQSFLPGGSHLCLPRSIGSCYSKRSPFGHVDARVSYITERARA